MRTARTCVTHHWQHLSPSKCHWMWLAMGLADRSTILKKSGNWAKAPMGLFSRAERGKRDKRFVLIMAINVHSSCSLLIHSGCAEASPVGPEKGGRLNLGDARNPIPDGHWAPEHCAPLWCCRWSQDWPNLPGHGVLRSGLRKWLLFKLDFKDLASLLDNMKSPFTEPQIKCLLIQLLRGVNHLHSRFMIHRDIKVSLLICANLNPNL